jgi:hypothetical protein
MLVCRTRRTAAGERRGTILLVALIAVMVIAALAGAMVLGGAAGGRERDGAVATDKALYIAEAGLSETIAALKASAGGAAGGVGSEAAPVAFGGGGYWTEVDSGVELATVTAWGRYGTALRSTQAVLTRHGSGIYDYAVFAGNQESDPGYDMPFDGTGNASDGVKGKVYSGGNVVISGGASIQGDVEVFGTVTGGTFNGNNEATTGVVVPPPDVDAMDYEHEHDFDVAGMFAGGATYALDALGGLAWQLPESSPGHIFRKNPSDRLLEIAGTAKDDYFLEDPYEAVSTSNSTSAGSGSPLTLSGIGGKPGPVSVDKVFYVDGNLWVHNHLSNGFTFSNSGNEQIQVTIVVKGNIYFTDNLIYQGTRQDAVAFIAIEDDAVPDSGNIVLGDPALGTLERLDAFLFAENNLYVNNSALPLTTHLEVNGNLTAGNSVRLPDGLAGRRTHVQVNHDNRIANSDVTLPGLAGLHYSGIPWVVHAWREVAPGP